MYFRFHIKKEVLQSENKLNYKQNQNRNFIKKITVIIAVKKTLQTK